MKTNREKNMIAPAHASTHPQVLCVCKDQRYARAPTTRRACILNGLVREPDKSEDARSNGDQREDDEKKLVKRKKLARKPATEKNFRK